jgi:hypothetical protein
MVKLAGEILVIGASRVESTESGPATTTIVTQQPRSFDYLGGKMPLYLLMACTGMVLLIAIANSANLLLARSVARRKEMTVHTASLSFRLIC